VRQNKFMAAGTGKQAEAEGGTLHATADDRPGGIAPGFSLTSRDILGFFTITREPARVDDRPLTGREADRSLD
jgi:hypothetical protein